MGTSKVAPAAPREPEVGARRLRAAICPTRRAPRRPPAVSFGAVRWQCTCSQEDPLLNVGVPAVGVGVGKFLWSAGQATVEVVGTVAKVVGTVADVAGNVVEVVADVLEA
jgi:hypothetical protein